MSAETEAVAALNAAAAVTALVGSGDEARIYPDFVPTAKALPSITVSRVDTDPVSTIHSATPIASLVTLEVWCAARTRDAAEDLATKAQAAMTAFRLLNRIPEFDDESGVFATVLTLVFLEQGA